MIYLYQSWVSVLCDKSRSERILLAEVASEIISVILNDSPTEELQLCPDFSSIIFYSSSEIHSLLGFRLNFVNYFISLYFLNLSLNYQGTELL